MEAKLSTLQRRHMLIAGKIRDEDISGDMLHSFTAMVSAVRIAAALIVLMGNRSSPKTAAAHVDKIPVNGPLVSNDLDEQIAEALIWEATDRLYICDHVDL
jgi:hypothetical protein